MNFNDFRKAKKALEEGLKPHLLDIIEMLRDGAKGVHDEYGVLAKYDAVTDNDEALSEAVREFANTLVEDEDFKSAEFSAATVAIEKVASRLMEERKDESTGVTIERDGKAIELTKDEIERIVESNAKELQLRELNYFLEEAYSRVSFDDDDEKLLNDYESLLKKLDTKEKRQSFLKSLHTPFLSFILSEMDDEKWNEFVKDTLDTLMRKTGVKTNE